MKPAIRILIVGWVVMAGGRVVPAQRELFVLTHVNVVDVASAAIQSDVNVSIADGRISTVSAAAPPRGARIVDGKGRYLIPGLWDMHVHWYDERFLPLFIANGVTGVRQMFGAPPHLMWKRRIEEGSLLGPRHVVAGVIVDGPKPVWPRSIVAADAPSGREAVQQTKRDGYDFVKVYSRLPRDAYFAIAQEAKRTGITFEGHVPNAVTAAEASDAGQKVIEHLTGLFRGGIAPVAAENETAWPALFARYRANGTWQCPTLTVHRSGGSLDDPSFTNDPRLKYMPAQVTERWKPANNPLRASWTAADYERARRAFAVQLNIVGAMQKAEVPMLAGTDTLNPFAFPGFSLHDELALLVRAGLTPAQALRTATVNPARYLERTQDFGAVARGHVADLVLLDANPLEDIAATKRIAAVVFRGQLYDRPTLDRMLATIEKLARAQ